MRILLDLDGVLANFVKGMYLAHGISNPYEKPENLGVFEMPEILGMSPKQFWEPANNSDFWYGLEHFKDTESLVNLALAYSDDVGFLTSPSAHQDSVYGKKRWLRHHYPDLCKRTLFGSAKELCAGPGVVLIDDRDAGIASFAAAGGIGITCPRPWNMMYRCKEPLSHIKSMLNGVVAAEEKSR